MSESDVNRILNKDGIEFVELGNGQSCEKMHIDDLMKANSRYRSWAKRVIDTTASGFFQIATYVCQNKGEGCRRHYHPDCDEFWVVIKGVIRFEIGEEKKIVDLYPGDVIFCKKNVWHKTYVISDEPGIRLSIGIDKMITIYGGDDNLGS